MKTSFENCASSRLMLPSSALASSSSSFNSNLRAELELISNYPHHPTTPKKVVRTILHLPMKLKFCMETLFNQTKSTS